MKLPSGEEVHGDYIEGYTDGYDLECPYPNANRSERYRHSFWVGRREKIGNYIPYDDIVSNLERVEKIENSREFNPTPKEIGQ